MADNFLDLLVDFLVSHVDPLDASERVTTYDRIIVALEAERESSRELAAHNARWECEGGLIAPETSDIELLGAYP